MNESDEKKKQKQKHNIARKKKQTKIHNELNIKTQGNGKFFSQMLRFEQSWFVC